MWRGAAFLAACVVGAGEALARGGNVDPRTAKVVGLVLLGGLAVALGREFERAIWPLPDREWNGRRPSEGFWRDGARILLQGLTVAAVPGAVAPLAYFVEFGYLFATSVLVFGGAAAVTALRLLAWIATTRRGWTRLAIVASAAVVVGGVWLGWSILAPAPIRAIDGDTVDRSGIRHRLAGFDAPEVAHSKCAAERERGLAATLRLRDLIAGAVRVDLSPVRARPDRWGRVLSRLTINGEDVAAVAVREGWGVVYHGRGPRHDWCS